MRPRESASTLESVHAPLGRCRRLTGALSRLQDTLTGLFWTQLEHVDPLIGQRIA